jgi:hypothetical protein
MKVEIVRGKDLHELLKNSWMIQYFILRYEWYCTRFRWENPNELGIEVDYLDGKDAIYVLIVHNKRVLFGWRIVDKKLSGSLPGEKELVSRRDEIFIDALSQGHVGEYEVTRFCSNPYFMDDSFGDKLTRAELKLALDLLFEASYGEIDQDWFFVFLNLKARIWLRKIMGYRKSNPQGTWNEQRVLSGEHAHRQGCPFQGFILGKNSSE